MDTFLAPFAAPHELPPYRGILAVDAKGFTAEPGSTHQAISGLIPKLTGLAFANAGLAEVWDDPAFFGPTGDGFAVGLPTPVLPYLVHPFLAELQRVLANHNARARREEALLRLRVSLNVGPLPADPADPYTGGNGTPRNDSHRLLDSTPVRAILAASSPKVTFVAAILSDRVYQDVVAAGYAGRHPDHFMEVPATVDGKDFAQRAWLYVPEPSGNLLRATGGGDRGAPSVSGENGPAADQDRGPSGAPISGEGAAPVQQIRKNYGQAANVVHGGMTMHQPDRGTR